MPRLNLQSKLPLLKITFKTPDSILNLILNFFHRCYFINSTFHNFSFPSFHFCLSAAWMASECYTQRLFSIIIRNNYFEWSWLPLCESASDAESSESLQKPHVLMSSVDHQIQAAFWLFDYFTKTTEALTPYIFILQTIMTVLAIAHG